MGLDGAGEWHELKKILPDFNNKRVLDLGCGFGWHCRFAIENGATSVVGVDISQKMIDEAKNKTTSDRIDYVCKPIEDVRFQKNSFDIIISSLAFHYIESFEDVLKEIKMWLVKGGEFISVEHPIFTAQGNQDWHYDNGGKAMHWPVDHYFSEGIRKLYS